MMSDLLIKLKPNDVRLYLKDIQKKMDKRAILFKNLNENDKSNENDFYDYKKTKFYKN